MRDLQRHEQTRRSQDDQAKDDRLRRRRPDVADDYLYVGDWCGEKLVDRARELGEEDGERRVGGALQQCAESPRHLEDVNRAYRVKVHAHSLTRSTNISSSELCLVWRSSNVTPASSRSARRPAMSIGPSCES